MRRVLWGRTLDARTLETRAPVCTVSWLRRGDGFELLANRDERRTRLPAAPPVRFEADGVRWLAPVDGDAGGTWVSVNERGVALCLLNDYRAVEPTAEPLVSRGWIVRELAHSDSAEQVLSRIEGRALAAVRGFVLLVLDRTPGQTAVVHWNARELRIERGEPRRPLLVSSGWNTVEVIARREALFDARVLAGDAAGRAERQREFHRLHEPERGPYSPCMHRDDASTVSTTRVHVSNGRALLEYRAGPPCELVEATQHELTWA